MSLSLNIEENVAALESFIDEVISVEAEVAAATIAKEVTIMRASGMGDDAIKARLEADFAARGRIFGQIETTTKAHVAGLISAASNGAQQEVYEDAGIESDLRRWVVVNLGPTATTKPCPDCPSRQDQVEPIDIWQIIGEPGSGWSVCVPWDYCLLVPVEVNMPGRIDVV